MKVRTAVPPLRWLQPPRMGLKNHFFGSTGVLQDHGAPAVFPAARAAACLVLIGRLMNRPDAGAPLCRRHLK